MWLHFAGFSSALLYPEGVERGSPKNRVASQREPCWSPGVVGRDSRVRPLPASPVGPDRTRGGRRGVPNEPPDDSDPPALRHHPSRPTDRIESESQLERGQSPAAGLGAALSWRPSAATRSSDASNITARHRHGSQWPHLHEQLEAKG